MPRIGRHVALLVLAVLVPTLAACEVIVPPPPPSTTTTVPAPPRAGESVVGLMPLDVTMTPQDRAELAVDLHADWYRPLSVLLGPGARGSCESCDAATAAGLSIALTVRNAATARTASTPPADAEAWRRQVRDVLRRVRPALLVVENEESSGLFYDGTPAQYLDQLRASCEESHALGVPCTNGGPVGSLVVFLVAADRFDHGDTAGACGYVTTALRPEQAGPFCDVERIDELPLQYREQIRRGRELLAGYRTLAAESVLDYVNFHWYHNDPDRPADPAALREAAAWLRSTVERAADHERGRAMGHLGDHRPAAPRPGRRRRALRRHLVQPGRRRR